MHLKSFICLTSDLKACYDTNIEKKGVENMYWNLIKLRKESNMTQADMAKLIGAKQYLTYGNKELGKAKFNLKEAMIIQKHFDMPLDYIFFTEKGD